MTTRPSGLYANLTMGAQVTDTIGPTYMRRKFWEMQVQDLVLQAQTLAGGAGVAAAITNPYSYVKTQYGLTEENFIGAAFGQFGFGCFTNKLVGNGNLNENTAVESVRKCVACGPGLRMEVFDRLVVPADNGLVGRQFLVEATLLSGVGGAMGAGMGVLGALLGGAVISHFKPTWLTLISQPAVVIALSSSGLIGLLFGYWPARSASRLDPVVAIRSQ